MKTLMILSLGLLAATTASAAEESVQLMKVSRYSGFVPPQFAFSVECQVGSDHSYILTRQGESREPRVTYPETIYTAKVPNARVARALIARAAKARLKRSDGPVDGPTNLYVGILEGEVVDQHVKLRGNNGGNGTVYENSAPGVDDLVEFGNANCPLPSRP